MRHFRPGLALFGLLVLLTLTTLTTVPASAATLPANTGMRPVPLAHLSSAGADQDILINATDTVTYEALVAGGRLNLAATGKGSFIDNFGGGKTYPASVDSHGNTTINTHIGKFVFDTTGLATTIPAKLGTHAKADITGAKTHSYTTLTYAHFFFTPIVNYTPMESGTIALTQDANGSIVPFSKVAGSVSALTITTGPKSSVSPINAPTFMFFGLSFQAKLNGKQTVFVTTSTSATSANGIAIIVGNGAAGALGQWSADLPA